MLLLAATLTACFVAIAFHYWRRLGNDEQWTVEEFRLFVRWTATGLLVPILLWLTFNVGLVGNPVWPAVQPITAGLAPWWRSFHLPAAAGVFFISSYWSGITFLWLLTQLALLLEERRSFKGI